MMHPSFREITESGESGELGAHDAQGFTVSPGNLGVLKMALEITPLFCLKVGSRVSSPQPIWPISPKKISYLG